MSDSIQRGVRPSEARPVHDRDRAHSDAETGLLLTAPPERKAKFNRETIRTAESFLFIRPEGMGDIILTLPAIAYIRRENPRARLAMAVRPMFAEWVSGMQVVEEVIPLDYPKRSTLALRRLGPFLRQVAQMRGRFDVAFDFKGDLRNTAIGAWSAQLVVGGKAHGTSFLLSGKYLDSEPLPIAERNLRIVSLEQIPAPEIEDYTWALRFRIEEPARQRVRSLLDAQENYIVIHPGASRPDKQWDSGKWRNLIGRYLNSGQTVVITGAGRADARRAATILEGLETQPTLVNLVDRTSCAVLTAIVEKARLVISPDTGIAHIAYAHQVPSVTLFGSDSEVLWGHKTPINVPLRSSGSSDRPGSDEAAHSIRAITVDQICAAAEMVLQAASQSAKSIL